MSQENLPPAPPERPHGHSRRNFLLGTAAGAVVGAAAGWFGRKLLTPADRPGRRTQPGLAESGAGAGPLALPGPFPGQVIEVHHPGSVRSSKNSQGYSERSREAVKAMIDRGMKELVGSEDAVQAWRHFFGPGDRV